MTPFNGKCQNLQKTPTHFWASTYHFKDNNILNNWPRQVGQDHRVQFSQWHHSMENFKIYKTFWDIFTLALTVSEILNLKIDDL